MRYYSAVIWIALIMISSCTPAISPQSTATSTAIPPTVEPSVTSVPATPTPGITLSPSPTPYPAVTSQLTLGDNHTCLLHPDGKVSCWGWNRFGQSGQDTSRTTISEQTVPGLEGIISISAGAYHTCALNWDGRIWCWGRNNVGQLGDGSHQDSSTPVLIRPTKPARYTAIHAGSMHNCAIEQSGDLYCWGSNRDGKLGYDKTQPFSLQPIKVTGLTTPIKLVSTGSNHTCAIDINNDLWCWGDGTFGQIGLIPFASSSAPVKIASVTTDVSYMQAGWFHSCLLLADGSVKCWGKNQEGELGNAALISRGDLITPVKMDKDISLLAVGGQTSCTYGVDGQVFCWGRNHHGQVGDHSHVDRLLPVPVVLPEPPRSIQIGGSHSCILSLTDQVYCWGANDLGQLGTYSIEPVLEQTQTVTP